MSLLVQRRDVHQLVERDERSSRARTRLSAGRRAIAQHRQAHAIGLAEQ
jgi:hypothetical protein